MRPILIGIALISGIACGCATPPTDTRASEATPVPASSPLDWLAGEWVTIGNVVMNEVWSHGINGAMIGAARVVVGGKVVATRFVAIQPQGDSLVLKWRGSGPGLEDNPPDNGRVLTFQQTSSSDSAIAFENPAEDHPRRVQFTHLPGDRLRIDFIGLHDGALHTQTYEYSRRK